MSKIVRDQQSKKSKQRKLRRLMHRLLPLFTLLLTCVTVFAVFVYAINLAVCNKTKDRIVSADELEGRFDVVIVLGCKVYEDGTMSARLSDRVSTGISVFSKGIGETILMSGDRSADGAYDEVGAMKNAAVDEGISEDRILLDPFGYSTYESITRLLKVYEGKRVVIVTQTYHLYRALYIADKLGIEAWGVSADARPYSDWLKSETRELLARVKDVFYTQIQPSVGLERE